MILYYTLFSILLDYIDVERTAGRSGRQSPRPPALRQERHSLARDLSPDSGKGVPSNGGHKKKHIVW